MKNLKKFVAEKITELSGIETSEEITDVKITGNELSISISGTQIGKINTEYDEIHILAEEIIFDEIRTIRNLLTEKRINEIEDKLKNQIEEIKNFTEKILKAANRDSSVYAGIENFGYHGKHWETEDEYVSGYPVIGLKITDFDNTDINIEFESAEEEIILDIEEIKQKIKNEINYKQ